MQIVRDRDSYDATTSVVAILLDVVAIWTAQLAAVWIRYSSGWIQLNEDVAAAMEDGAFAMRLYGQYAVAAAAALPIYLAVFQILKLYTRPQNGTFSGRIPRLARACILGACGVLICSGLLKNAVPFISNGAIVASMFTVTAFVLFERAIAFRAEFALARRMPPCHNAAILGANHDALHFAAAIRQEPRLRTRICSIIPVNGEKPVLGLPSGLMAEPGQNYKDAILASKADMVILASHSLSHDETVELVVFCEQHLIRFSMIPDIFRMMTHRMEFSMIGNVPLVGIGRWPLDQVWNRFAKRVLDIWGSAVGILFSAPIVLVAAACIKMESKGPVFYRQKRCGQGGRAFTMLKLRTMAADADGGGSKPGWTTEDDPRRTRVGAFLRRWNIDELPQFLNVFLGDMSLVGPRPEQPFFVERFSSGIEHYMWRHVSKPGMTGWAQVNGLRGDTSISERVKYDLYYLENWSLAFDFKILVRTLFSYRNAG